MGENEFCSEIWSYGVLNQTLSQPRAVKKFLSFVVANTESIIFVPFFCSRYFMNDDKWIKSAHVRNKTQVDPKSIWKLNMNMNI